MEFKKTGLLGLAIAGMAMAWSGQASAAQQCPRGAVNVMENGRWEPAQVIRASRNGSSCLVRYERSARAEGWVPAERVADRGRDWNRGDRHHPQEMFREGNRVMVEERPGHWREAIVVSNRYPRLRVHFVGGGRSMDQWVMADKVRVGGDDRPNWQNRR